MEEYSTMWKHCNLLLSTELMLKILNLKIENKIEAQNYDTIAFHAIRQ